MPLFFHCSLQGYTIWTVAQLFLHCSYSWLEAIHGTRIWRTMGWLQHVSFHDSTYLLDLRRYGIDPINSSRESLCNPVGPSGCAPGVSCAKLLETCKCTSRTSAGQICYMLHPLSKNMPCIIVPVPFLASMRRIRQISRTIVVKYIWGQMPSVIRHCPLQAWGDDRSAPRYAFISQPLQS